MAGGEIFMDSQMSHTGHHGWGSPKVVLMMLLILVIGAVAIVSIIRDRIVNPPQWQVTVTGQGKISYQSDLATVNLGVQVDKVAKPDAALNQLNTTMAKVLAAVKKLGIADADIQTQNYTLYPQYDYSNNAAVLIGYSANQIVAVKVRNLDKAADMVSKVIAAASVAGANQVNGITFDVSSLEDLKQQARVKAIADAKTKADSLANAAGVRLGNIIGWYENFISVPGQPQPYYGVDGKGGVGTTPVPVVTNGSQDVVVEIGLNYRIK